MFKPDLELRQWYDGIHPIDYTAIMKHRVAEMLRCEEDEEYREAVLMMCKNDPVRFINDWCITVNPKNKRKKLPTLMPFILYPRQEELVYWLANLILERGVNGAIDKSRDTGASWLCVAVSVWLLMFHDGVDIGWGSRKADLVDRHKDPKTIFHKLRTIIEYLPVWMKPDIKDYTDKLMLITNGEKDTTIGGEGGDNIGRGGRTTVYFKDESAFYENPIAIENALGENTDVQIDISTHNGTGTIFYQATRNYPQDRLFILDWSDIPGRDASWLAAKRNEYVMKNNIAGFKQEIMRDPTGAVDKPLIDSRHLEACVDAHLKLGIDVTGEDIFGYDIADGGSDANARAHQKGVLIKDVKEWDTDIDITHSSDELFKEAQKKKVTTIKYDCIGVGAGCKGDFRKANAKVEENKQIRIIPFDARSRVHKPKCKYKKSGQTSDRKNEDMFMNLKAQSWWALRDKCHNTYLWVEYGIECDPDDIISFDSTMPNWKTLRDQLLQPTYDEGNAGKILIDKMPEGAKSPNMADAVMIVQAPVKKNKLRILHNIKGLH